MERAARHHARRHLPQSAAERIGLEDTLRDVLVVSRNAAIAAALTADDLNVIPVDPDETPGWPAFAAAAHLLVLELGDPDHMVDVVKSLRRDDIEVTILVIADSVSDSPRLIALRLTDDEVKTLSLPLTQNRLMRAVSRALLAREAADARLEEAYQALAASDDDDSWMPSVAGVDWGTGSAEDGEPILSIDASAPTRRVEPVFDRPATPEPAAWTPTEPTWTPEPAATASIPAPAADPLTDPDWVAAPATEFASFAADPTAPADAINDWMSAYSWASVAAATGADTWAPEIPTWTTADEPDSAPAAAARVEPVPASHEPAPYEPAPYEPAAYSPADAPAADPAVDPLTAPEWPVSSPDVVLTAASFEVDFSTTEMAWPSFEPDSFSAADLEPRPAAPEAPAARADAPPAASRPAPPLSDYPAYPGHAGTHTGSAAPAARADVPAPAAPVAPASPAHTAQPSGYTADPSLDLPPVPGSGKRRLAPWARPRPQRHDQDGPEEFDDLSDHASEAPTAYLPPAAPFSPPAAPYEAPAAYVPLAAPYVPPAHTPAPGDLPGGAFDPVYPPLPPMPVPGQHAAHPTTRAEAKAADRAAKDAKARAAEEAKARATQAKSGHPAPQPFPPTAPFPPAQRDTSPSMPTARGTRSVADAEERRRMKAAADAERAARARAEAEVRAAERAANEAAKAAKVRADAEAKAAVENARLAAVEAKLRARADAEAAKNAERASAETAKAMQAKAVADARAAAEATKAVEKARAEAARIAEAQARSDEKAAKLRADADAKAAEEAARHAEKAAIEAGRAQDRARIVNERASHAQAKVDARLASEAAKAAKIKAEMDAHRAGVRAREDAERARVEAKLNAEAARVETIARVESLIQETKIKAEADKIVNEAVRNAEQEFEARAQANRPVYYGPELEPPGIGYLHQLMAMTDTLAAPSQVCEELAFVAMEHLECEAVAIMIPDGDAWATASGIGIGRQDVRFRLSEEHWFVREVLGREAVAILDETASLTDKLTGVPLANWKYLVGLPMPRANSILVAARSDLPFQGDVMEVFSEGIEDYVNELAETLETRDVAREIHDRRRRR